MKKIIVLFLSCCLFKISLAQTFSLNELISFCSSNENEFDTHVTQKGYSFFKSIPDPNPKLADEVVYVNTDNLNNEKYFISKKHREIIFQTSNSSYYLFLKNELTTYGFNFTSTRSQKGDITLTYVKRSKNNYSEVIILSHQEKSKKYLKYSIIILSS
jgi:hypothetical protein